MENECEDGVCGFYNAPIQVSANMLTLSPVENTTTLRLIIIATADRICVSECGTNYYYESQNDTDTFTIIHNYRTHKGRVPVVTITPQISGKPTGVFESVYARNNNLTFVSFTVSSGLKYLNLRSNDITSLFLPSIANVETLDLQNNPILNLETISTIGVDGIKNLTKLVEINLKGTLVSTVNLGHCKCLTSVLYDQTNSQTGKRPLVILPKEYGGHHV